MPGDVEVTRFFSTVADAVAFADRVKNNPAWAGAIMRSPRGDEITIE
jgi:hypothetical protein